MQFIRVLGGGGNWLHHSTTERVETFLKSYPESCMPGQPNLVALKRNNNTYSSDVASLFLSLEGEIKVGL